MYIHKTYIFVPTWIMGCIGVSIVASKIVSKAAVDGNLLIYEYILLYINIVIVHLLYIYSFLQFLDIGDEVTSTLYYSTYGYIFLYQNLHYIIWKTLTPIGNGISCLLYYMSSPRRRRFRHRLIRYWLAHRLYTIPTYYTIRFIR